MAGTLDEFYDFLETDLRDRRAESFLVRQMREELLAREDTKKGSGAGELAAAFAGAQSGPAGRRAYLLTALEVLQRTKKLALCRKPEEDTAGPLAKDLLLEYGLRVGCPAFEEGRAWNKARMVPALLEHLQARPDLPPPDPGLVRTLHAELWETLLLWRAGDYIDNLKRGRRNSREMRFLEAYLEERYGGAEGQKGGSVLGTVAGRTRAGAGRGQLTKEQIGEAEVLFKSLQREEYSWVMLPVEIDPGTGAGLYFVGIDWLNKDRDHPLLERKGPNDWCRIVGLYMGTLDPEPAARGNIDLLTWSGRQSEFGRMCDFPTVQEGIAWLHREIRVKAGEIFQNDVEQVPDGCPLGFERFFHPEGEGWAGQETEARALGRQAFEEDAKEEAERGGPWQ